MPIRSKFFSRRRSLTVFRDAAAGGATTLANAAAAGATTLTLASATGFAIGDVLRVGAGEEIERHDIVGLTGVTATLNKPLRADHAAGEPIVEQTGYTLGATQGGFTMNQAKESTDVFSDDQRLVYDALPGYGTFSASTNVLGLTPHLFAMAMGMPFSVIAGTGADSDNPLVLTTDFNEVDTVDNQCVVVTHLLQDGTVRVQELWGCAVDYTQLSVQLASGQPGPVALRFDVYGRAVEYDGAAPFIASTLYRAGKGKLFGKLRGVGYFGDSDAVGATTAMAVAAAAGATAITVDDASGLAAQDYIRLASEDLVEIHWIRSIAGNVLTLKTPLKRGHAVDVAVVKQTKTRFGGVTRNGATFTVGGSRTAQYDGTRDYPVGYQPESVVVAIALAFQSLTLEDRARALGIPESEIVSGVLDLTTRVGEARITAVYVEGILRDGWVNLLVLWGCAQDLANAAVTFGGGQETAQPFNGKPASGVQLLQYPQ